MFYGFLCWVLVAYVLGWLGGFTQAVMVAFVLLGLVFAGFWCEVGLVVCLLMVCLLLRLG